MSILAFASGGGPAAHRRPTQRWVWRQRMSWIQTLLFAQALVVTPVLAQGTGGNAAKAPAKSPAVKAAQGEPLSPQRQEPTSTYLKRKAEIRKRILSYRSLMKDGKIVRTHSRVRVKLRNEEMMTGVVRDGLFVERPAGLEFVRAEMKQPGAGLRLWYYNQTDGYIFIPYTMIKTYRVLQRLTDVEVKEIRDLIVEREKRALAEGARRKEKLQERRRQQREDQETSKKLEKLAEELEADEKRKQEEKRLLKLVDEFPPAEGWGAARIRELNLRRLTIKVFPNARERRFIEVFEDWKKGHEIWLKKQKDAGQGGEKGQRRDVAEPAPGQPTPKPDSGEPGPGPDGGKQ